MTLDEQFAKDLFDMCLDFSVWESNTKGNWVIQIRFPSSVKFDNLEDIREFLTSYFSQELEIEKIFKQDISGCNEWADYHFYRLHFKSAYAVEDHLKVYKD